MSTANAARLPRWIFAVAAVMALAIIALLAVLIVVLTGGSDSDSADSGADAEEEMFTVSGTVTLIDSGIERYAGQCNGTNGYDDMSPGTQVVVKDASGTVLGASSLQPGEPDDSVTCVFPFEVEGVPSGVSNLYSVEVGTRGAFNFSEEEADQIELSLGY